MRLILIVMRLVTILNSESHSDSPELGSPTQPDNIHSHLLRPPVPPPQPGGWNRLHQVSWTISSSTDETLPENLNLDSAEKGKLSYNINQWNLKIFNSKFLRLFGKSSKVAE